MEAIKRGVSGIAIGGMVTFIFLTILTLNELEVPISKIWLYMLASFIIGIYFGVASLLFENERWSPLKKTVIHFSLSIVVYFSVALPIGWIPLTPWPIIISILIFIMLYALIWVGFQRYAKKIEASMNEQLQKR